ncbi:MAG TPA: SH3 domain-containing protein [Anaerolineae bacterium]|nr:SH3 domain-containing protein [Anaerolineae bacterium]
MTGSIVAGRRREPVLVLMSLALLAALLLPAATPAAASPSQSYGMPPYAQALTNVNIRSGAGTGYPVIGAVYAGQIVQVLSIGQGGWYQIACQSNGYVTCWITGSPNYVRPLYSLPAYPGCPGNHPSCTPPLPPPPAPPPAPSPPSPCTPSCTPPAGPVTQIQAQRVVNVRSGPGMGYHIVGQLAPWQVVQVTGVSADRYWYRIVCPFYCTTECWVSSQSWLVKPVHY